MLVRQLTDGLLLRQPEPADAVELADVIERNRRMLEEWMPWAHWQTLEQTRTFIARARQEASAMQSLNVVVELDGRLVGAGGFNRLDWTHRTGFIGYWLDAEAQGQGIATRMVQALTDHGFGSWQLHRLDIRAGVENHKSRAVAERAGFELEGVLRDAERVGDRWVSHAVYGLLAEDWDRRAAGG